MSEWQFRMMTADEINLDPVQNEFFAPEEGFAAALVRETIQNSLDAGAEPELPVTVRFSFIQTNNAIDDLQFFSGLKPHLVAQELAARPQWHDPVPLLLVEDFGTRGLCGDPRQIDDVPTEDSEPKNDFFYFWRNIGRSEKQEAQRGRWGLGKAVFTGSSRIRSFLGLTVRQSDGRTLLMGQSIGRIHAIDGIKYAFYGYYAEHLPGGPPVPIEDPHIIDTFRAFSEVTRHTEPGLSVCIPFPQPELNPGDIVEEVLASYSLPIMRGGLVVEIVTHDGTIHLDENTIKHVTSAVGGPGLQAHVRFIESVCAFQDSQFVQLSPVGENQAPEWGTPTSFLDVSTLRGRLDAGELLGFKVPVVVRRKGGSRTQDTFNVYLQHDSTIGAGKAEFIRQGLTITQINRPPKGSYRGLVLVEDGALATLLGDSENPAHTKWQERSDKVRDNYQNGAFTVRFVSNAVRQLASVFSAPVEGVERELLADIFFIQTPPSEEEMAVEKPQDLAEEEVVVPPDVPPLPQRRRRVNLVKVERGFRVSHVETEDVPASIVIEAAYATRRGNPFARYSTADFEMGTGDVILSIRNADYEIERNRVLLTPLGAGFSAEVVGFDPHRDIQVRVLEADTQ